MAPPSDEDDDEDGTEDSSEDDSDDSEGEAPAMSNVPGAPGALGTAASIPTAVSVEYNPAEYAHITNSVPADVRDLFSYITAFQPTTMELPAKLKPFIPDFIPSVGDIDTFCKVPRPDDKPDNFGLVVVDEPSSKMSNPAIVTTWLSHLENVSANFVEGILSTVEDAASQPQLVDKWITDLRETQAQKAPPTVYYSKPMPAIESLMQEWPPGFEEVLNSDLQLPPPNIDLDMEQYVKMLCAILDVPVHNNLVESLHVIFTLYLEFRENVHFKAA
jgi:intraflagellar transport protein 46